MFVSFVQPNYLWWLLALPAILGLGLLGGRRLARWRNGISLALRVLLLVALIGSLAGTQLVRPVRQLTTIFLVDTSDSITPNQRAAQEQFIAEALRAMPAGDQAAIIVFGQNALIERVPSAERILGRIQSVPVVARTDIEQALTLGLALFPADTQKRLVLLSDGGENSGRALSALRLARTRDVSIDIVPVISAAGAEVALTTLRLPSQARTGQEIAFVAAVESSVAQNATLRFLVDQQVLNETPIALPAGTSEYTATVVLNDQGYHRVTAQIVPTDDTRRQNNEGSALINLTGKPKVLIVAGEPADGENIAPALIAASLTPEIVPPEGLPTTLAGLADYEAVVLANVPANTMAEETQQALQSFVRDLGRGLIMLGGENSYGIGGYTGTPIEEALPVEMQLRNREKYPPVSVAIVFDISGSMSEVVGGKQKVAIAAEGAARVVQLLRDFDEITVIPFDTASQNAYGPVPGSERDTAQREIIARGVAGGGGINIHDSLESAGTALRNREAPIRHIIILADGSDSEQQEGSIPLAQRYLRDGITTSTISIGSGGDTPFLRNLAKAGGGRSFLVEDALSLPDVILQDAQLSLAPYMVEKTFAPLLGSDSPIMASMLNTPWPNLHGYNGSVPKDNASVVLWALDDAPLLAQWQYGLGRSVAWTSDMKGKWARDLVVWSEFPRLVAQMVGWTLPVISNDNISVDTTFVGTELEVTLTARDASNAPLTGLNVRGDVVSDGGALAGLSLPEVGAGVYRGRVASPQAGTYFLQLGGADVEGRPVFQRTAGVIVPYSPEYRQGQANPALLQALAAQSAGRSLAAPAAAFDHTLDAVTRATPIGFALLLLAMLLLPLDIAVRRLRFGKIRLARRPKPAAASDPLLGGLSAAKQRARRQTTSTTQGVPADAAEPAPIAGAPVYRSAPEYRPPAPPEVAATQEVPAASQPAPPAPPAPTPSMAPPKAVDLDEISDPLERLRAAKNRARRR
jgi:uncharacterized membrane protein